MRTSECGSFIASELKYKNCTAEATFYISVDKDGKELQEYAQCLRGIMVTIIEAHDIRFCQHFATVRGNLLGT